MIPELDIYRSANLLVKQHGNSAPIRSDSANALKMGTVLVVLISPLTYSGAMTPAASHGARPVALWTTVMGFPLLLRYSLFAPKLYFC